jgi:hypothetical protein
MNTQETLFRSAEIAILLVQEVCREALIEKYAKGEELSAQRDRRRLARACNNAVAW